MDEKKATPEVEAPGWDGLMFIGEIDLSNIPESPTYIGEECVISTGTITRDRLRTAGVNLDEIKIEAL